MAPIAALLCTEEPSTQLAPLDADCKCTRTSHKGNAGTSQTPVEHAHTAIRCRALRMVERPDDSILIIVGDVVGHNQRAAAAMAGLRSVCRLFAAETGDPAAILERLDAYVINEPDARFASMWIARFDPSAGVLTYSCAGHPPPLEVLQAETSDQRRAVALADQLLDGSPRDDDALLVLVDIRISESA